MRLKSRRRGQGPRVIALACASVLAAILVAAPLASGPPALARPAPRASAAPGRTRWRTRRGSGGRWGSRRWPHQPAWPSARPGGVWVADTGHDRVLEFSAAGRELAAFGKNLDQPTGIATDAAGHVWVADTGHDRVVEFSSAGRVLAIFGSARGGRGQLNHPVALAVTPSRRRLGR